MYLYNFNSCCSGQWSSTTSDFITNFRNDVLILVVVDNGLVLFMCITKYYFVSRS